MASIVVVGRATIAKQLHGWQLLPRPQHFTELYFTRQQLPSAARVHDAQEVSFTVRNIEHRTLTYYYELNAVSESGKLQALGNGKITVAHDQLREVSNSIHIPAVDRPRLAIQVRLTYDDQDENNGADAQQSIKYWLRIIGAQS